MSVAAARLPALLRRFRTYRCVAAPLDNQPADPRRGPPHGGELRQAAGAAAEVERAAPRRKALIIHAGCDGAYLRASLGRGAGMCHPRQRNHRPPRRPQLSPRRGTSTHIKGAGLTDLKRRRTSPSHGRELRQAGGTAAPKSRAAPALPFCLGKFVPTGDISPRFYKSYDDRCSHN